MPFVRSILAQLLLTTSFFAFLIHNIDTLNRELIH